MVTPPPRPTMVTPPTTEDHYSILGVKQDAESKTIISAYRRLVLLIHPDRNRNANATTAFQQLVRAYETLCDETKRQAYDQIYLALRGFTTPHSSSTSTSPWPESLSDIDQLAALRQSKSDRALQWMATFEIYFARFNNLQKRIQQLEAELRAFDNVIAAEGLIAAQISSQTAYSWSPVYVQGNNAGRDKTRWDAFGREGAAQRDLKGQQLRDANADLQDEMDRISQARLQRNAADAADDEKITVTEARIQVKQAEQLKENKTNKEDNPRPNKLRYNECLIKNRGRTPKQKK